MESFRLASLIKETNFYCPYFRQVIQVLSRNVASNIVYFAIFAALLMAVRATNNPKLFSSAIKLFITLIIRHVLSYKKIKSVTLKRFNRNQRYFDNLCKSKHGLLYLVPKSRINFLLIQKV